jgi:hypothetical protein
MIDEEKAAAELAAQEETEAKLRRLEVSVWGKISFCTGRTVGYGYLW